MKVSVSVPPEKTSHAQLRNSQFGNWRLGSWELILPPWPVSLIAAAYLAAHLFSLARSLEDIDSINFALGLRDFDVAQHQPHPPGYPLYIGIGHVALGLVRLALPRVLPSTAEALALALLSTLAGAVAVVSLGLIFS